MEVPVDGHQQTEDWSCGPAALKILLSRFDHPVSEEQLIALTRSGPAGGTTHEGLMDAARRLGYRVVAFSNASVSDIRGMIARGLPVLVDFQGRKGGHFAVVVGAKDGRLEFEDPRESGTPRYSMDERVFEARWYNVTYPDRRTIRRWMMAVIP